MRARAAAAAAVVSLALAGGAAACSAPAAPRPAQPSTSAGPVCPASYRPADPNRPRVALSFALAADRRSVEGSEHVTFIPDRPVRELVFRLWPNAANAPAGTQLTVTAVTLDAGSPSPSPAGATPARPAGSLATSFQTESLGGRPGTQGTLLSVPLDGEQPAGHPIGATLVFRLALPAPAFDRWGSTGRTAWWASGQPMLAWAAGRGWQRDGAGPIPAEYSTSEAADLTVTVTVPAGDTVLMTGGQGGGVPAGPGRQAWRASSPSARDVSVTVGRFALARGQAAGIPITAGVAPDLGEPADPAGLLAQTQRAVLALADRYGPFPYASLAVTALPALTSGGIEYPGAIQVGGRRWDVVVPHEVAHQYFYGLVGDNQAHDPWLDEAFATYSEALVNGDQAQYLPALSAPGRVDAPVAAWGTDATDYYRTTYDKGAAALLTARDQAGPAAFDRALRCYLTANAWRVAAPADVAAALADLPAARTVLRRAGALP